ESLSNETVRPAQGALRRERACPQDARGDGQRGARAGARKPEAIGARARRDETSRQARPGRQGRQGRQRRLNRQGRIARKNKARRQAEPRQVEEDAGPKTEELTVVAVIGSCRESTLRSAKKGRLEVAAVGGRGDGSGRRRRLLRVAGPRLHLGKGGGVREGA